MDTRFLIMYRQTLIKPGISGKYFTNREAIPLVQTCEIVYLFANFQELGYNRKNNALSP